MREDKALPERVWREYRRILDDNDLSVDYPDAVHQQVEAILREPGIDDPRLVDMTGIPFVTIDYAESLDLDQAVHIERGAGGEGFVVRYALADPSWYVRPQSPLFEEALRRGTSYYLPGLVVPMLPSALSDGIVSLNPGVDRRSVVFEMILDAEGRAESTRVVRARIHSRAKLSYDGVQELHDSGGHGPLAGQPFTESLTLLRDVGELRAAEARRRNVIRYNREEVVVDVVESDGENGAEAEFQASRAPRNAAARWNEQISLLCNIEGGRLLVSRKKSSAVVQPVFRVHEPPDPRSLEHLEHILRDLAGVYGLDERRFAWHRDGGASETLADYLDRMHASKVDERLLEAVERQALIINRRSSYSSAPNIHYALGVRPYSRFSAPMRELVGVFTHKEALEELGLSDGIGEPAADEALRDLVIASANRARERQRGIEKATLRLAMDDLFRRDVAMPKERRPWRAATTLGLRPSRLYARMDDPPLEVKIYVRDLERVAGTSLRLADDDVTLRDKGGRPRYRLGDGLDLRCRGFDDRRDRWLFDVRPTHS